MYVASQKSWPDRLRRPDAALLTAGMPNCRYPWGQQPTAYVDTFQKVARTLNAATCGVAMVWSPNPARGYPWRGADGTSVYAGHAACLTGCQPARMPAAGVHPCMQTCTACHAPAHPQVYQQACLADEDVVTAVMSLSLQKVKLRVACNCSSRAWHLATCSQSEAA